MDSLAAPQDRLVEQLLSPRTQAQRRLKVCVEKGVECGSVCVCARWGQAPGLWDVTGAGRARVHRGWAPDPPEGEAQHCCL